MRKAHTRDSLQALSKLGELVDGRYRIVSQPPVVIPARDLAAALRHDRGRCRDRPCTTSSGSTGPPCRTTGGTCWNSSRSSTWPARSSASAASAPGRSSCCCRAATTQDPLFLQVKEATRSVLEDHLPKSRYRNPGERVVQGQRMMQAASDIYLGWTKGVQADRYCYWRQLRDMKASALVDTMSAAVPGVLRRAVRVDPGPGPRPLRRPGRDRRIPRHRRRFRPVHHRLLPAVRRPERTRLPGTSSQPSSTGKVPAVEGV